MKWKHLQWKICFKADKKGVTVLAVTPFLEKLRYIDDWKPFGVPAEKHRIF